MTNVWVKALSNEGKKWFRNHLKSSVTKAGAVPILAFYWRDTLNDMIKAGLKEGRDFEVIEE